MPLNPGEEGPLTEEEQDDADAAAEDRSNAFIDKTAAGSQIAAPTPELADVDETLSGAPNVKPAPVPGTAVEPSTPTAAAPTTPQEAGAGAFAASQEEIRLLKDKAAAGQELDENERARLHQAAQDEDDIRVQRELEAQAQKDARDDYQKKIDAADEKVRDFKFHDYFEDPKHGSKAIARFAIFLGGLGNLGGQAPGAPNRALDGLEQNIKADHDEQLAYLNSAKYFADKQREGYTDLVKAQQDDRHAAELDYANKKLATANKFAELAQTARGKANYDAAMVEVAKLKKSAYDDQQKVFEDIQRQKLEDARAQAALAKAHKGRGGGGGVASADRIAAFEAAAQAIPPGDPVPKEVYRLGVAAGFKPKDIQAQVDRARESGKKSLPPGSGKGGVAPGELPKDAVFLDNEPIGLAPSGRGGAAAVGQQLLKYRNSIKSLTELKNYVESHGLIGRSTTAAGDLYDRAVLAVAATTQAPGTDRTTQHEADTLKTWHTLDAGAIQRSIDHLTALEKDFRGTLRPLPKQPSTSTPTAAQKQVMERLTALRVQFGAPQ